jgi:hypothetical protein
MVWLYGLTDSEVSRFPCTVLSVQVTGTLEVTSRPVEGGASPTDHSVFKPRTLGVKVFISPTPTAQGPGISIREGGELLERIRQARQVNTVSVDPGGVGPFEELLLTNYVLPQDFENGDGAEIEVEFTELTYATAETSAPIPRRPRERRRVNRGPQATAPETRTSLAAGLFERYTGMGLIHSTTPRR